jgi:3-hydroxyisobutyrate dehydrogenase-like beta-hydroxyacid dehydrogenase
MKIALIGYGEVGQIFAREVLAGGATELRAYDILFREFAHSESHRTVAARDGVKIATTAREAAAGADVVISAVTAASVKDVAGEAASYLSAGQYFFDVNSASPGTKTQAA